MDKTGFEREIGFGGFEHLAAPSSPSRQRRGLSGRSHLSSKQSQKMDESGFPDEGKNFPDRPDLIRCKASKNSLFGCVGNWLIRH
jgi:hypothetical protein